MIARENPPHSQRVCVVVVSSLLVPLVPLVPLVLVSAGELPQMCIPDPSAVPSSMPDLLSTQTAAFCRLSCTR
ncbi:MAG: hypothetical protein ACK528_13795, partial [Alphaproteobacteria bacterium]